MTRFGMIRIGMKQPGMAQLWPGRGGDLFAATRGPVPIQHALREFILL
jgi:hypothetical protein